MSNVAPISPAQESNDEQRLNSFGLSSTLFHTALAPGTSKARSRSALALRTSAGNDIYHDTMEQLALMLAPMGWTPVLVEGQPRLLHPDRFMSFTIASATNVAHPDRRRSPRTRGKGPATRHSLATSAVQDMPLFDLPGATIDPSVVAVAAKSEFWMLLHERTAAGLSLEFARPSDMTTGGSVVGWADSISVGAFDVDGDFSIFDGSVDDNDEDFDVRVERF